MIGGDATIYEKLKPFWNHGQADLLLWLYRPWPACQLTQNLILSNLLQAFNEGMVLATKAGVDPELMVDILSNSAAKSGLVSFKAPYVFKRDFSTNFSTRWMHKDTGLMLETGAELGVPLPLTGLTRHFSRQQFQKATRMRICAALSRC